MKKWLLVMLCGTGVALGSEHPKVDAALAECDAHVTGLRAGFAQAPETPDDKHRVQSRLRLMVAVDQYIRVFAMRDWPSLGFSARETEAVNRELVARMVAVDAANTAELKGLLEKRGWFTISEYGEEADTNAWLLVQHADADPAFQREIAARLEPLAARGETRPSNFAYLFDRIASSFDDPSKRRPQRYGTQGRCTGPGLWEPYPVEDPDNLEERRRGAGLTSMAEYQRMFKDVCKVTTPASPGGTP